MTAKATLKQGFARISNTILEALSAAPLSGVELKIVIFVIRRTYGWATSDPTTGKADVMTAADVAGGIRTSPRTVERPLTGLVRNKVLIRLPLKDQANKFAYGINTTVEEWGAEGGDWRFFHAELREAQQAEAYTQKSVVEIRKIAYREYAKERSEDTQNSVVTPINNTENVTEGSATPFELPPVEDTNPDDFTHIEACGSSFTQAFVKYFHGNKPPQWAQRYAEQCRQIITTPSSGLEIGWVEAQVRGLQGPINGPRADEQSGNFGHERFLARLLREREPRASPRRLEDDSRVLPPQESFGEARTGKAQIA